MNQYQRILKPTYYIGNHFNVGVDAAFHLGKHGEPLHIILLNGTIIETTIIRTANTNVSFRFNGRNDWKQFVHANYYLYDLIAFQVNNLHTITIIPNAK